MRTLDIAWLAGLLEGEGCFRYHSQGKGRIHPGTPGFQLQMTDRDVVAKFANLMARPLLGPYGPYAHRGKEVWACYVTGPQAVGWMMTLYPLLGERRQEKIREMISVWKLQRQSPSFINKRKTHCIRGHVFDSMNTRMSPSGRRICRACQRVGHN